MSTSPAAASRNSTCSVGAALERQVERTRLRVPPPVAPARRRRRAAAAACLLAGEVELGGQLVAVGAARGHRAVLPPRAPVTSLAKPSPARAATAGPKPSESIVWPSSTSAGLLGRDQRLERALCDVRLEVLGRRGDDEHLIHAVGARALAGDASGSAADHGNTTSRPARRSLTARAAVISSSDTSRSSPRRVSATTSIAAHPAHPLLDDLGDPRRRRRPASPSSISAPSPRSRAAQPAQPRARRAATDPASSPRSVERQRRRAASRAPA